MGPIWRDFENCTLEAKLFTWKCTLLFLLQIVDATNGSIRDFRSETNGKVLLQKFLLHIFILEIFYFSFYFLRKQDLIRISRINFFSMSHDLETEELAIF